MLRGQCTSVHDPYGSFTLHGTGNGSRTRNGNRNNGLLYVILYCSHCTETGTGTWPIVLVPVPSPFAVPLPCSVNEPLYKNEAILSCKNTRTNLQAVWRVQNLLRLFLRFIFGIYLIYLLISLCWCKNIIIRFFCSIFLHINLSAPFKYYTSVCTAKYTIVILRPISSFFWCIGHYC